MVGSRLGNIQPMCYKPGHSWQGPFVYLNAPFAKKAFFIVCMTEEPDKIKSSLISKAYPKTKQTTQNKQTN